MTTEYDNAPINISKKKDTISISKKETVSLTKKSGTVSISKKTNIINITKKVPVYQITKQQGNSFGPLMINLNWTARPSLLNNRLGFIGIIKSMISQSGAIDLDLGILYEMKNGEAGSLQALGGDFGSFNAPPFVHLSGDDRTGENPDGETATINGPHWVKIKRLLVYTYIYDGAINWNDTDAIVTVQNPSPSEPDIVVHVADGQNPNRRCCAIAMLTNDKDNIVITRLCEYFFDQSHMDKTYQWGLTWKEATKT